MMTTTDAEQLDGIARALNRREWIPTQGEIAVGAAFLQEVQAAEASQSFPRRPGTQDRLRAEDVVVLVTLVSRIEQVLLPLWRLPDTSPMTALVELYVRGAQPIVQQADTLLTAWQEATFREPTADDIAFEQRRLETSAEEAAALWRFNEARHWEAQPERRDQWNELMPAWSRLSVVSSVMTAAVTGDVEY